MHIKWNICISIWHAMAILSSRILWVKNMKFRNFPFAGTFFLSPFLGSKLLIKSYALGFAIWLQEKLSFLQTRMHMLLVTVLRYFHGKLKYWFLYVGHTLLSFLISIHFQHVIRELPSSPVPASCCKALLEACRKCCFSFSVFTSF